MLKRLSSPCFVTFLDYFVRPPEHIGDPDCFLIMDYLPDMPGSSLRDRLGKNKGEKAALPFDEVVQAFIRYADGLALMHRSGVFHRDIKPSNLYFPQGRPEKACIMDLGVARDSKGTLTFAGQVPGTPDYMPPELAKAETRGDAGVDIYALGLCLYEALTGQRALPRLPIGAQAIPAYLERAEKKEQPQFDAPLVKASPGLDGLLVRMTHPEWQQREQNAQRVADALRNSLGKQRQEPKQSLPPAAPAIVPALASQQYPEIKEGLLGSSIPGSSPPPGHPAPYGAGPSSPAAGRKPRSSAASENRQPVSAEQDEAYTSGTDVGGAGVRREEKFRPPDETIGTTGYDATKIIGDKVAALRKSVNIRIFKKIVVAAAGLCLLAAGAGVAWRYREVLGVGAGRTWEAVVARSEVLWQFTRDRYDSFRFWRDVDTFWGDIERFKVERGIVTAPEKYCEITNAIQVLRRGMTVSVEQKYERFLTPPRSANRKALQTTQNLHVAYADLLVAASNECRSVADKLKGQAIEAYRAAKKQEGDNRFRAWTAWKPSLDPAQVVLDEKEIKDAERSIAITLLEEAYDAYSNGDLVRGDGSRKKWLAATEGRDRTPEEKTLCEQVILKRMECGRKIAQELFDQALSAYRSGSFEEGEKKRRDWEQASQKFLNDAEKGKALNELDAAEKDCEKMIVVAAEKGKATENLRQAAEAGQNADRHDLEKLREAQTRLRDAIVKAKGFKISAEEAETVADQLARDIQKLTEDVPVRIVFKDHDLKPAVTAEWSEDNKKTWMNWSPDVLVKPGRQIWIRFLRADYEEIVTREAQVAQPVKGVAVDAPETARWKPSAALQDLLALRQAVDKAQWPAADVLIKKGSALKDPGHQADWDEMKKVVGQRNDTEKQIADLLEALSKLENGLETNTAGGLADLVWPPDRHAGDPRVIAAGKNLSTAIVKWVERAVESVEPDDDAAAKGVLALASVVRVISDKTKEELLKKLDDVAGNRLVAAWIARLTEIRAGFEKDPVASLKNLKWPPENAIVEQHPDVQKARGALAADAATWFSAMAASEEDLEDRAARLKQAEELLDLQAIGQLLGAEHAAVLNKVKGARGIYVLKLSNDSGMAATIRQGTSPEEKLEAGGARSMSLLERHDAITAGAPGFKSKTVQVVWEPGGGRIYKLGPFEPLPIDVTILGTEPALAPPVVASLLNDRQELLPGRGFGPQKLPPGRYQVVFKRADYEAQMKEIDLKLGDRPRTLAPDAWVATADLQALDTAETALKKKDYSGAAQSLAKLTKEKFESDIHTERCKTVAETVTGHFQEKAAGYLSDRQKWFFEQECFETCTRYMEPLQRPARVKPDKPEIPLWAWKRLPEDMRLKMDSTEIALTSHEQKVIKGMDDALLKLQVISDGFYDKEIEAVAESVILGFPLNEAILARTQKAREACEAKIKLMESRGLLTDDFKRRLDNAVRAHAALVKLGQASK